MIVYCLLTLRLHSLGLGVLPLLSFVLCFDMVVAP